MAAAAGGGGGGSGGRHGFYGGAAPSPLSHNHFGNNSNSGFTSLAAGYNLNRSSSEKFEDFVPHHSTNPNLGPTNFLMQCAPNQGLLAQNDQSLMNQHGLIGLGDNINNNNNNLFHLGYFQDNTKNSDQTSVPSLFTNGADNNDPSALLRGLTSSSSSSAVVNDFGDSDNGNFQGLMNSLAATTDHQGRSGSIFDLHFGNNLSMGGSDRLTLDFLGVNGGMMSNVNGRGGRNGAPLDVDMKFSHPNHPFGKS